MQQMQSDVLFQALAEKHRQQVSEIQRKREDLERIQAEIRERMGALPRIYAQSAVASSAPSFVTGTTNFMSGVRHDRVYGPPSASIVRLAADNGSNVYDMRPQFEKFDKLYREPPRPITIRMRTPPPAEIKHIDTSKLEENDKIAARYQQSIIDYYKEYNKSVTDQFERNRAIEKDRNEHRRNERTDHSLEPMLKEQLEKTRHQSEMFFTKLAAHVIELNRTLEDDRKRRREEREQLFKKEKEIKAELENRVTTSTQVRPEHAQASTQVALIDEAKMRAAASRTAYVTGVGPVEPSGIISGHPVFDMASYQVVGGAPTGGGIQMIDGGGGGQVIIAGVPQAQPPQRLASKQHLVTHTHDNPYVQSIIAEIQQELDDIDRERRRLLIKERTKAAEEQLEKMLADLSLEKERLCREMVSLARVNSLLSPEGNGGKSTLDPASTGAVADVLQLIKDQLRRVCKIQSEANLMRHESVMSHLKTVWSHSDAHTVVEGAPQIPLRRIPAPVVPNPIPINPPTYGLLPSLVLFYDYIVGIPNGSMTSVVLNVSIVRITRGQHGEEVVDLLVDLGELMPAGVTHASRHLDGVAPPALGALPNEFRGVAMIRFKHDIPRQLPADPTIFAMVSLGGQPAAVSNKSEGFARSLLPLVRSGDVPDQPATGRFVANFQSQSNMFANASLYYRLVRLEDAESEMRSWPVNLGRMNLYLPLSSVGHQHQ